MTPLLLATVLATATEEFMAGLAALPDTAAARAYFSLAARHYDEAWATGAKSPAVARNRGRAHCLAGDIARAVAALHDGLAIAPWHTGLQTDLQELRRIILPANDVELRPPDLGTIRQRVAPLDLLLIACGSGLLLTTGLIARIGFGSRRCWPLLLTGGLGVLLLFGLAGRRWWEEWQHRVPAIVVVATPDQILRAGNAHVYPPRRERPLPVGLEGRGLASRGGWIQIRFGENVTGWLPESAVITLHHSPDSLAGIAPSRPREGPGSQQRRGFAVGSTGF